MEAIDDSGFLDIHTQLFGLEHQFERVVYRYSGGTGKFDFAQPNPEQHFFLGFPALFR